MSDCRPSINAQHELVSEITVFFLKIYAADEPSVAVQNDFQRRRALGRGTGVQWTAVLGVLRVSEALS